jgi:subtilisin family serine protease
MSLPGPRAALRRLPLAAAIAFAAAAPSLAAANPLLHGRANDSWRVLRAPGARAMPYLIQLEAPSLAGAAREGRVAAAQGGRLDVHGAAATGYVAELRRAQAAFLQSAGARLGRTLAPVAPAFQFQHAFNGMAVRLTADEARRLAGHPGVRALTPLRSVPVSTDRGPQLIGAASFWEGTLDGVADRIFRGSFDPPDALANRGEGIVVGSIDTGLNFASPSFAATDPAGYAHVNPLGAGRYLGLCAQPTPDWTPQCNDKVIGAYDFVAPFMADVLASDPGATDGPGPTDENGHGSHTASTAAGNAVQAQVNGGPTARISGVAPHANLIVYNACYTTGDGRGTCLEPSLVAAVDQAVADGIVDVVNYSIAGGSDPWNEPASQAFLDAVDAGVFVAASAGNSGPSSGTVDHDEPWTITVAASTHSRGAFANKLRVTAPQPVPDPLADLVLGIPTSAVPLAAAIAAPLAYDAADPLQCAPAAPGSYAGKVVMIRRGTCTFASKVLNAEAGDALAVILVNNAEGAFNPGVDGTHIPVVTLLKSQGDPLAAFATGPGAAGTDVLLAYPAEPTEEVPDRIANFSSRGPAPLAQLKPDIAAPGSNILAALSGEPGSAGTLSGTSMASPHVAGAAALLRKAHPDWTVAEVKSALMLTAKTDGIVSLPGGDPATVFDMGAGRAQANLAYASGLVMNETSYAYLRADPSRGGEPSALNVPSLGSDTCVGRCTFVRRFRNPTHDASSWTLSLDGIAGTVTPATLALAPGEVAAVTFALDVDGRPQGEYATGGVTLTPAEGRALHMPAAVYVDPFRLELAPASLEVDATVGGTATASFTVRNAGNAGLAWSLLAGTQAVPVVNQPPDTRDGLVSSIYADQNVGALVADDFTLDQPTTFHAFEVPGFLFANFGDTVDMYADSYTWSVYADAGGKPAGYPGGGAAPVWTLTLAPDAPGVAAASNSLDVDLDAAGASLTLPPGTYWLVAYPTFAAHNVGGIDVSWFRFLLGTRAGALGQTFNNDPSFGGVPGSTSWDDMTLSWDGHYGGAMIGRADRQCTPAWATPDATAGTLGAGAAQTVSLAIDTGGLAAGSHVGQLCLQSNDPARPLTLIPIRLDLAD